MTSRERSIVDSAGGARQVGGCSLLHRFVNDRSQFRLVRTEQEKIDDAVLERRSALLDRLGRIDGIDPADDQRQQPKQRIEDDRSNQHRTGNGPAGKTQALGDDPVIDQGHYHQVAQAAGRQRQQSRKNIDPLQLATRPFEFVFDQTITLRRRGPQASRESRNWNCLPWRQ